MNASAERFDACLGERGVIPEALGPGARATLCRIIDDQQLGLEQTCGTRLRADLVGTLHLNAAGVVALCYLGPSEFEVRNGAENHAHVRRLVWDALVDYLDSQQESLWYRLVAAARDYGLWHAEFAALFENIERTARQR